MYTVSSQTSYSSTPIVPPEISTGKIFFFFFKGNYTEDADLVSQGFKLSLRVAGGFEKNNKIGLHFLRSLVNKLITQLVSVFLL